MAVRMWPRARGCDSVAVGATLSECGSRECVHHNVAVIEYGPIVTKTVCGCQIALGVYMAVMLKRLGKTKIP